MNVYLKLRMVNIKLIDARVMIDEAYVDIDMILEKYKLKVEGN